MVKFSKIDETWVRVDSTEEILMTLEKALIFYAPKFQFSPMYKAKVWDGRIKIFSAFQGRLPAGLLLIASNILKDYKQSFDEGCRNLFKGDWALGTNLTERYTPHDYQIATRDFALSRNRCTIESMTSSGKSLSMFMMVDALLQANQKIFIFKNKIKRSLSKIKWQGCNSKVTSVRLGLSR